jgi:Cd2+/Zn2+-exporting ATPase
VEKKMRDIKYSLSDLSCASCADRIERKVNKLDDVEVASVNFVTKEITITPKKSYDSETLFSKIKKIVKDEESSTEVCEISTNLLFAIEGLDCANCAAKIEDKLIKTDGIIDASVDFMSKKLKLVLSNVSEKNKIIDITQRIISKLEPGVTISEINQGGDSDVEEVDESTLKKDFIIFGVGILLFISALFVKEDTLPHYVLLILSYFIIGGEVVLKAFKNIFRGKVFDENFLMTIATVGAFIIGEHPEAVAVMIFFQIGEFFQDIAVNRSRRSIKKLLDIRPDTAMIQNGKNSVEMRIEEVGIGEIMIIRPGERIPLDGEVITGKSTIDTKVLTGESVPTSVFPGEQVLSGCININGVLTVMVTKLSSESTVSKVLELVENASSKKAPTEKFITKFARVYTPIVVIIAALLAFIPPLLIEGATFDEWIYRALIFLVISCPCALVVSIPLGFFGGIGAASRNGILVKGGNFLEALNDIEIAVFDKTGTLTEGTFTVTEINTMNGLSNEELLEKAAYVESYSNHPIAVSVVSKYNKEINQNLLSKVEEISGHGVKATYQGAEILIGNARLMDKEGIDFQESKSLGSILYIAIDGQYAGNIVVSDQIKKDSKTAIQMLKSFGIKKIVMLTGDKKLVADSVGKELMIDEVYSELLPEDKLIIVEELLKQKSKKGKLFFAGDGINDTPVLARSDIGIAMGGLGADAAIDVADVVIMNDEPSKIGTAVFVAKRTRKIVWQNIYFALGIKFMFLALGALGIATMWEAVIADVGVSLLAVLNAMRVLNYKYDKSL